MWSRTQAVPAHGAGGRGGCGGGGGEGWGVDSGAGDSACRRGNRSLRAEKKKEGRKKKKTE